MVGDVVAAPSCRHLVPRAPLVAARLAPRSGHNQRIATRDTPRRRWMAHVRPPDPWGVGGPIREGPVTQPLLGSVPRRSLGAGEGIRTPDPLITNQLLYRTELRQPEQSEIVAQLMPQRQEARPSWLLSIGASRRRQRVSGGGRPAVRTESPARPAQHLCCLRSFSVDFRRYPHSSRLALARHGIGHDGSRCTAGLSARTATSPSCGAGGPLQTRRRRRRRPR